jgi:Flp pilus assembly protein TadG
VSPSRRFTSGRHTFVRAVRPSQRQGQAGQALVIMVLALVVLMGMSGLVIDGGNAMANERGVQNGADAAAEAGALVLASRLAGASTPAGGWDSSVNAAILASAAANGVTVEAAYYTDICGIPLKADGTGSLSAGGSYDFANAKVVGTGLPNPTSTTPDCPSLTVGPTAGVLVKTHRDVGTYFARVLGINTMPVGAITTAAAGFLQESCAATDSEYCGLLPLAMPINQVSCDGNNNVVDTGNQWSSDGRTVYKVPLCKNGPGNVGWLDWSPKGGGTSELIDQVNDPTNPAVPLPSWQYITATGNPNANGLEAAIRAYDGQRVLVPQFDLTCNPKNNIDPDNTSPAINTGPNFGCPAGYLGGNGSNQWYRIPAFAHFRLCDSSDADCVAAGAPFGAYLNGNNAAICDTGNGATSCIVGKFESIVRTGTIGAGVGGGTGNSKAIGVQLIK